MVVLYVSLSRGHAYTITELDPIRGTDGEFKIDPKSNKVKQGPESSSNMRGVGSSNSRSYPTTLSSLVSEMNGDLV